MMRWFALAVLVLGQGGCTVSQVAPPPTVPPPPPTAPAAAPTVPRAVVVPTPINMDDVMGAIQQQTVFVAAADHVSAITLLNHFTRYNIATQGVAQVSTERSGQLLYLLDTEAPGSHRLRMFDVATGKERAVRTGIADVAAERRALAVAKDGRVLVLKADAQHAWVDAYEGLALEPRGTVMDKPGCGDRLLVADSRAAIVCLASGEIGIDDLRGNHVAIDTTLPGLIAATASEAGALYVATADHQLGVVGPGTTTLTTIPWPAEWASGTVLSDGLAIGGGYMLVAEKVDDAARLRVMATYTWADRRSYRLAGVPHGGVIALWPFAYYTFDGSVRHVDLNSGLLETMTDVGEGATPGAVVNG